MAYKFNCPKCNSEIVTNFLKPGEETLCQNCETRSLIPTSASYIEGRAIKPKRSDEVPAVETNSGSSGTEGWNQPSYQSRGMQAWDPQGLLIMTLFLTFVPAGILWSLNFKYFRQPDKWRTGILSVAGVLVLVLLMIEYFESLPFYAYIALNVSQGFYYMNSQKTAFKTFLEEGGKKASFLRPILISCALIAIIALLYGMFHESFWETVIHKRDDYSEWKELQQSGKNQEALSLAQEINESKKLSPFLRTYVMAQSLWDAKQLDSAAQIVEKYIREYPSDSGMIWYREIIYAYSDYGVGMYEQSLKRVTDYICNNPDNLTAWEFRSLVLRRIELRDFDFAEKLDPTDAQLLAKMRNRYQDSLAYQRDLVWFQLIDPQRKNDALRLARSYQRAYPENGMSDVALGIAFAEVGYADSGLQVIDRYLKNHPGDVFALENRFVVKFRSLAADRKFDEALALINEYSREYPESQQAREMKRMLDEGMKDAEAGQ